MRVERLIIVMVLGMASLLADTKAGALEVPRVTAVPTGQVALTFDDGPGPATSKVLDVLRDMGVPATFFVVGTQVRQRPAEVARMAAEGHSVQNHTWSHPDLRRRADGVIAGELQRTSDAVEAITGVRPTCVRPPYGARNMRTDAAAAAQGLRTVIWNVDSGDSRRRRPTAEQIVRNVLRQANGGGLMVLFHDGGARHDATSAALPAVIAGLRERGYSFVTVCAPG